MCAHTFYFNWMRRDRLIKSLSQCEYNMWCVTTALWSVDMQGSRRTMKRENYVICNPYKNQSRLPPKHDSRAHSCCPFFCFLGIILYCWRLNVKYRAHAPSVQRRCSCMYSSSMWLHSCWLAVAPKTCQKCNPWAAFKHAAQKTDDFTRKCQIQSSLNHMHT